MDYTPITPRTLVRARTTSDSHDPPDTDGWVWLWTLVMAASLTWSLLWLGGAAADPCDRGECWNVLIGVVMWFWGQLAVAVPMLVGLVALLRYTLRGNRGVPALGLAMLAANAAFSAAFLAYLARY
jgi:hypothetical protein